MQPMTLPPTQYARREGVAVAYETFGDLATGEPLLLVMGLDFQMVWWPEDFCEQLVAAGFAVVRFDNRDSGLSTHFASPPQNPWQALLGRARPAYSGQDMLDDALAVMDRVGWASAHVLGVSLGAALSQALALLHPERVRSLISCLSAPATAHPLRTLTYVRFGVFSKINSITRSASGSPVDQLVAVYRVLCSPGFAFPEEWTRATAMISHARSPRDPGTTARQLAAGRTLTLPPLTTLAVPTLVISGLDDPLITVQAGLDVARQVPYARFVAYAGMGHHLPEELWPEIIDQVTTVTARS